MNVSESTELLPLAACAAINQRAAGAYLHDLRGSLQAVHGAMELLARVGKSGAADAARADKASALAKRAVANHEAFINALLKRLTHPASAMPDGTTVALARLLQDAVRFTRHDSERAEVDVLCRPVGDPLIAGDGDQLFVLLVGLVYAAIDSANPRDTLDISVEATAADAVLMIRGGGGPALEPQRLTHAYAADFFARQGGSLEITRNADGTPLLTARHPLAPAPI